MKRKLNAMIAVMLCAACAAPTLPAYAEVTVENDRFTYDPEQALLISDAYAAPEEAHPAEGEFYHPTVFPEYDYYFVTGFGEEPTFYYYEDERRERNQPCMYFTAVNGDGEIMTRSFIFMYDIERMNDVEFKVGDVFKLVNVNAEEEKANWDENDPDTGCMSYERNIAQGLRDWAWSGAPKCCWWVSHDAGVSDEDFPNLVRRQHFVVTDNLLEKFGDEFAKVCEEESALPRVNNILNKMPDDLEVIPCVIGGDANSDEIVDIVDVVATQKYVMGSRTLEDEQLIAADVDKNGSVDGSDSLNILKYVVGELDSLDGLTEK